MDRKKLIAALAGEPYAAFGTGSPAEEGQKPSGLAALFGGAYTGLGNLAKRAMGNSANAVTTGTYNPAPVVEAAMLPMGTGAIAGVPVKAGEAVLGAGPIRAYHGSPHDFDRFDLSKIGTGEGAQAYGHGLYFAENPHTAQTYRDALSGKPVNLPADVDSPMFKPAMREAIANNAVQVAGKDVELAKQSLADQINRYPAGSNARQDYEAALDMLHENPHKYAGRMYEVNINADPAHFLDWDKLLSQQHGKVKEAATALAGKRMDDLLAAQKPYGITNPHDTLTGSEFFNGLAIKDAPRFANLNKFSSEKIAEAGIPGIKYLDQGSRGAGQGSSNYVVFDDKLIDILKKYGLAGAAPLGAAGLAGIDPPKHGLAAMEL